MKRSSDMGFYRSKFQVNPNGDEDESQLSETGENKFTASLRLDGIEIHNCVTGEGPDAAVIAVVNATIRLFNSYFMNNNILVYTPSLPANETCSLIHLIVENSTFIANGISEPFGPGIMLAGCTNLRVEVHRATFRTAPISLRAAGSTTITFTEVSFDNSQVVGSAVTVTLSAKENVISFTNCNITNHSSSHLSAMSIRVEEVPRNRSTVLLSNVNFTRNEKVKNSGAALSVISRFSVDPATIHITLNDCWFVNNSAVDSGGAVYFSKIDTATFNRCRFVGNAGTVGGAIYFNLATNVTFNKCQFFQNSARHQGDSFISTGGAVHAQKSNLVIDSCNFTRNYASFSGSALHISDSPNSSIRDTYMEEDVEDDFTLSPYSSLLFIATSPAATQEPTIRLLRNQFVSKTRNSTDHSLVMLNGQITDNNATVACPSGHILRQSVRAAPDFTYPYAYEEQAIWCQACPRNTYRLVLENVGRRIIGDKVDDIGKLPQHCYKCPEFSICSYGIPVPYENYWMSEIKGAVEMKLCPHSSCSRKESIDSDLGFQRCVNERAGAMCTECSEGYTYFVRMSYSPCVPLGDCWSYGTDTLYILFFSIFFFLLLMFLYKILTGMAENLRCKKQRSSENNQGLNDRVQTHTHNNDTHLNPDSNDDDQLLNVEAPNEENDDGDTLITNSDSAFASIDRGENRNKSSPSRPVQSSGNSAAEPVTTGSVPKSQSLAGFLMSIVFFYQLLPIVYPRISSSAIPFDQITNTLVELFRFSPPLSASGICSIGTTHLAVSRYFTVMSFYWIQFVFIVVLFLLAFLFFSFSRSSRIDPFREQNVKMIGTHFCSAFLFLQLLWYIPLTRIGLTSLHCVEFEGKNSVYDDVSTVCHENWQIFAIVYLTCCVVPLCLTLDIGAQSLVNGEMSVKFYAFLCVFPIFIVPWIPLSCCLRSHQRLNDGAGGQAERTTMDNEEIPAGLRSVPQQLTVVIQSIVVKPFRSFFRTPVVHLGYLTVILSRNFVIVAVGTLLTDRPVWCSIVVAVVCVFFLFDHLIVQPFACKLANHIEAISLLVLSLFSLMNVYAAAVRELSATVSENASKALNAFDTLYRVVVMVVYTGAVVFVIIRFCKFVCCRCKKTSPRE